MLRQALLSLETFYQWHRTRLWFLAGLIGLTLAALATLGVMRDLGWLATPEAHWTTGTLLIIFLAALGCEYLDSSLGMGYGTTLTPLLMLAGYEPLQIVPAVLLSELVTGLAAGAMHHRDGNVDLRHDPAARRTFGLLGLLSAVGAIVAVMLAVKISAQWFSLLIVVIVLSMGLITLLTARRQIRYRRGGILTIGLVAAFNKGLSGGGYGPLVTSGQVVSGVPARQAVAITSMAEALTCAVGLAAYLYFRSGIDWALTLPLVAGALLSVPLATATVRHLPEASIRRGVGLFTLILGAILLGRLLG
ncbi:MAG: sulfite exporter TauE/SafE family protein [Chromatiaceae bacterium]|nr:sulfite exporter TauE/SafE family protein [Candidatus Thioaporhodococcus sediminis]